MIDWKQKCQHRCHYNCTARIYNKRYAEEQSLKIEAVMENLELEGQSSILDLGCGTGLLIPRIQRTVENVVGLDISKGMLKEIGRFKKHSENTHFILADADYTPLCDNHFDAVLAITLLQNMPNPRKTLQEAKRIAKCNASIIVTGLKKRFTKRSFEKLFEDAKLKVRILKTNDSLKCYIAICKKP